MLYNNKLDSINNEIISIKSNYISKDIEGIEVNVGINSELRGNQISVFKNNNYHLKYAKTIALSNHIDFENFKPTMQFLVTKNIDRNNDKSKADLFISKEASLKLGLNQLSQGLFVLKMKEIIR